MWLIEIIVGNEVFYSIVWEELLELSVKLTCQSFIVGNNQGWFIHALDDLTHGIGLTCPSRTL